MHKTKSGFTIVELLIVIVVIGILAAITVVAYNGIQARAKNSKQVTAAKNYYKLFELYKTANGSLPSESGCLGTNYVDTNSDGIKDCGNGGGLTNVSDTLLSKLSTQGSLPEAMIDQIYDSVGYRRSGIFYDAAGGKLYFSYMAAMSLCVMSAGLFHSRVD